MDKNTADEDLGVFWPMFPHDVLPLKEGEHVYVIFEDPENSHGLWVTRIAEPNEISDVNFTPGIKKYEKNEDNDFTKISAEQAVQDTDEALKTEKGKGSPSEGFVVEGVPLFKARVGDRCIEGSNNSAIVLGRDRPSDIDSGEKEEAGTIDIVVGRSDKDDMNMADDKARVYISMKSDVDSNFEIDAGDAAGAQASIVSKADEVRIVARSGFKIVVGGDQEFKFFVNDAGDVTLETSGDTILDTPNLTVISNAIKLGSNGSSEPLVLGNILLNEVLTPLVAALVSDASFGAFGVSGGALPATAGSIASVQSALAKILSKNHKTE